jgi:hypothetical protein
MENNKRYIEIPTNENLIYRHIIEFLLIGTSYSNQEKDVLAEFIKLSNDYSALPVDKRNKFIFSQEMKKEVAVKLGMKEWRQVSTVISTIKSKDLYGLKVIDDDNNILESLLIKPDLNVGSYNIIINFTKSNLKIQNEQTSTNDISGQENEGDNDSIEALKLAPIDLKNESED